MDINIDNLFKEYFPLLAIDNELKDFQKKNIKNILEQNNTLCIMPTGGGKSWIYWLAGVASKGVSIVISPLIALIDEQAQKIEQQGFTVLSLHSGVPTGSQLDKLRDFYNKKLNPDFIFVSPERIATDGLFEYCIRSRKNDIKLITIDEIHCVSQWGLNFRPFYKQIPDFLNIVFGENWPPILGLSATLNPKDINEISTDFKIKNDNIFTDELLLRTEIELKALKFSSEDDKENKLWQLLEIHKKDKILIYLYRKYNKRGIDDLTNKSIGKGFRAINFHGDMSSTERQKIINDFKNNNYDIVFATNAFGMGIDIPDIRVIIHFMIPESVEQYYQEVGRAARDKKAAQAYILYSNKNIEVRKKDFIDKSFPNIDSIKDIHKKITNCQKGLRTLKYFEDEDIQQVLPYLIKNKVISIVTKSVTNINIFKEIINDDLKRLFQITSTKGIISILKKSNCEPIYLSHLVFSEILNMNSSLINSLDKCLIVDNKYEMIPEDILNQIESDIQKKREYKHELLDYFAYILNSYNSPKEFHQEIGLYLGVDKHKLDKIHKTLNGELVRSKSEVIIANLLYNNSINYVYEKELFYENNHYFKPDFTIFINNEEYYWEHLGLLGQDIYDERWIKKYKIYQKYFENRLIITYEGTRITDATMEQIEILKRKFIN